MPDHWVRAARAADIAEDTVTGVLLDGEDVALYNLGGRYHATENICTHAMARLSDGYLDGDTIECPLHGGRFDIRTGSALTPPACAAIKVFPVRLDGDDILVDLGEED